jgi:biopolymer transport protein TolQ
MQDLFQTLAVGGVIEAFEEASIIVKAVMLLLLAMSLFGWYVIGLKYFYIRRAARETHLFMESFWRSRDIEQIYKQAQALRRSPVSAMFLAGYTELAKLHSDERPNRDRDHDADLENVQRALHRTQLLETTKLEAMVPFLATTGSAAPFIGLFGTVIGIINAFHEIKQKGNATLATVSTPISEALWATAIGLLAAIPAVMAYNYFQRRIRVQASMMQTFEKDYLNIIRRHFLT